MNSGAPLGIGTYTKQTLFGLVLIFSRVGPVVYPQRLQEQFRDILFGTPIRGSHQFARCVECPGHAHSAEWP
jgi:hypothetical protein